MSASVAAVLMARLTARFYDVDTEGSLDVWRGFSPEPHVIDVGFLGRPPQCKRPIIADCAQSIGSKHDPSTAQICVYSLNEDKVISCGEGGMACTNDPILADRLRRIRNHGENVDATIIGYNYRMTELQAAIARVELRELDSRVRARREVAHELYPLLENVRGPADMDSHAFYVYPIWAENKTPIVNALQKAGVPVERNYGRLLHQMPAIRKHVGHVILPRAERMWRDELFYLRPRDIKREDIPRIAEVINGAT
jgi:dTDP-4-amino-4,6-dideoxygalactose transaminase